MSEEKKDIEQSTDMAAEPVGAAMHADVSTLGYDIDNWPGMPLVGPSNLEEMNARIDHRFLVGTSDVGRSGYRESL